MNDATRMWITSVPAFGPEDVGVLLGLDLDSREPGERIVSDLLDRGHEGEEGVFYLLPFDLAARCARRGDRLAVELFTSVEVLAQGQDHRTGELHVHVAGVLAGAGPDGHVTLLRREIVTDVDPVRRDGTPQGVLLADHQGPTTLPELLARLAAGDASLAVLNAE
jgi:hypothetical protein